MNPVGETRIICLVIPTLKGGGMERVMSELANYFSEKGHEVHIFFLVNHSPFYTINPEINIHFPKLNYDQQKGKRIKFWLFILRYLRKNIVRLKADTVFSIPQGYSMVTILALLGTGIPVYISDRNSPNMPLKSLDLKARKLLYPKAAGIVAQTSFAKSGLLNKGIRNDNIEVIPNLIKEITNYPVPATEKKIILSIGRLVREKNQEELIEIFSEIDHNGWELHIVGSGPLKEKLIQKANDRGVADAVIFTPRVADVDKVMATAAIFAFTSIYEGFPNSLVEAMAYPLACISYDCIAGPSDIIDDHKNGFLVIRGDKEQYKNKLVQLMESKELRESFKKESLQIRKTLSREVIGDKFLNFILQPHGRNS